MVNSRKPVAPGEGERRAQRGYTRQYKSAAAAIYAALVRNELNWVGLADRKAGGADDVVLGLPGRVIGHQFKTSQFPERFNLETLLIGATGLLVQLVHAWQSLRGDFPNEIVEIRLVTNDYPSNNDRLVNGGHSAAFLKEFELNPNRTLAEWKNSRWQSFIDKLAEASGLDASAFEGFLQGLRILTGVAADFISYHELPPESGDQVDQISSLLPKLVADPRDKDRWTRAELLQELGWRDTFLLRRSHQFPIGAYVQRNIKTEEALLAAIGRNDSGYVALIGSPGSGKSTILQSILFDSSEYVVVRYLAFVPGEGQGIGRAEADDFLDDLNTQLQKSGLVSPLFIAKTLQERRQQFEGLLQHASDRFFQKGVRTLIIIDGLDHIPREETPQRSLLAELPLPSSIPAGVLIVLGTQHLELSDLKPAVYEQAALAERNVIVASLSCEAIYHMMELLGLDMASSREKVFELSQGQPLVAHYLIEALLNADKTQQEALLAGEFSFDGNIAAIYASAWRHIDGDVEARDVMGYIAHAEGSIEPELLVRAVSESAVEKVLKSTGHLLHRGKHGWSVFHNSFRLFILSKPRLRFGEVDSNYSSNVYKKLAELARVAGSVSPQRWLELRYLARAKQYKSVLDLAQPARFRGQFSEGRPDADIQADIRLAFDAAKYVGNATDVFRLLLAGDEIDRRATALRDASGIVDARLAINDIDGARAYAEINEKDRYKVVGALLKVGEIDQAREVFDRIDPMREILAGRITDIYQRRDELFRWAEIAFRFRDEDQINAVINRLSNPEPEEVWGIQDAAALGADLRFLVARAVIRSGFSIDPHQVAEKFHINDDFLYLLIEAGLAAHKRSDDKSAHAFLDGAVAHIDFRKIESRIRQQVALVAMELGDIAMARTVFPDLVQPTVAMMDDISDADTLKEIAHAVVEYAVLLKMLDETAKGCIPSKRAVLQPLQNHLSVIGSLLGQAKLGQPLVLSDVVRATKNALAYLDFAGVGDNEEWYVGYKISAAAPVLGKALLHAARRCGTEGFEEVVSEFDRSFEIVNKKNRTRIEFRYEIIAEIYECDHDADGACRRLDQLLSDFYETTPEEQIKHFASIATVFARVGRLDRAQELLNRAYEETLGYALAPKKDVQYALWWNVFEAANVADPDGRRARIDFLMKQIDGMAFTEGSGSAERIVADILTEATMLDAATGFAAAQVMVGHGMLDWGGVVNALLLGVVRRQPQLSGVCAVTWASLALPYYGEPYRPNKVGEFITRAIEVASKTDLPSLIEILRLSIEAEGRVQTRAPLLERLVKAADLRGMGNAQLDEAYRRWSAEAPIEREVGTPSPYDKVTSLDELEKTLLDKGNDEHTYQAAYAFIRLVSAADINKARDIFERFPVIQKDVQARFSLFELALSSGEELLARSLVDGFNNERVDERSGWGYWSGSGRLKYFQAHLMLDGGAVRKDAYLELVGELAAGRESVQSVLLKIEDIIPVIDASPDWPTLWEHLAEQLKTTREYAIGHEFGVSDDNPHTDEELIVALYRWALSLSLSELTRNVRIGALRLLSQEGGAAIFSLLAGDLLRGQGDEPAEALQLLLADNSDVSAASLGELVASLVDHPDYAVSVMASRLSERWGLVVSPSCADLPNVYSMHMEGNGDAFEKPALVDPVSGAMIAEDPLGWTFAFKDLVEMLSKISGLPIINVRHRCRMFIEQWGGLDSFGVKATERLRAKLNSLELRWKYNRPHMVVAARAIRYVANEIQHAGMLNERDEPWLCYEMGYPEGRFSFLSPDVRPDYIDRIVADYAYWHKKDEWLNLVDEDISPLHAREEKVIAEIRRFHCRTAGIEFKQECVRGPFLELDRYDDISNVIAEIPPAVLVRRIVPLTDEPASTIVRRFSQSRTPEIPEDMLIICPYWLELLSWRQHPENWLIYVDRDGQVVAKVSWWRDGGPVGKDAIWGEGIIVTVTSEGRNQIEAVVGDLKIFVYAHRSITSDGEKVDTVSRYARAVE